MRWLCKQLGNAFDHVFYLHLYKDVYGRPTRETALAHWMRYGCTVSPTRLRGLQDVTTDTLRQYGVDTHMHRKRYQLYGYTEAELFYDWVLREGPFARGRDLGDAVRAAAIDVVTRALPQTVHARTSKHIETTLCRRAKKVRASRTPKQETPPQACTHYSDANLLVPSTSCTFVRVPTAVCNALPRPPNTPLDPLRALGVDAVYILNLKRRSDRRCRMGLQLARVGIPATSVHYFEAADGATDALKDQYTAYATWLTKDPTPNVYNRLESAGAYACYQSYQRLCAYILEHTTHERVLLLEDDACFHRDVWTVWAAAKPTAPEADILRLGANQTNWEHCEVREGAYVVPNRKYHWAMGAFALCMTRRALAAWRDTLARASKEQPMGTADLMLWHAVQARGLVDVVLFPNAVIADVGDSDIRGARDVEAFCTRRRWTAADYYGFDDSVASPIVRRWLATDGHRRFVFIIPSYNNAEWVERNLASVCTQAYPHWRAMYVDDASTDTTLALAKQIVEAHGCTHRFTFVANPTRQHQAHARYVAYTHPSTTSDEVAIFLDGDDWLVDASVLTTLDKQYRDHDLVCSYGQFIEYENGEAHPDRVRGAQSYPADVVKANAYRAHAKWVTQHLRTVEAGLLQRIPKAYLQHEGDWIRCCTDVAEMLFVLERSGGRHRNAGRPLLVYNKDNSKRYTNSYYNRHKLPKEAAYREALLGRYFAGPLRIRPRGGLCNRLRVTLSYRLHCMCVSRQLVVQWTADDACPGHFLEWFEPLSDTTFCNTYDDDAASVDYDGCGVHPDHPQYVTDSLVPLTDVRARVQALVDVLGDYVAVHVRRTDHVDLAKAHDRYTTDADVDAFLSLYPTHTVYVATDNANTYETLKTKYGSRIPLPWHTPVMEDSALRHTSVEDAVVDLYMCARAHAFQGSGWSSFSDTIEALRTQRVDWSTLG